MRFTSKKRLALAGAVAAALGAMATLGSGVTFGLFSDSVSSGTNSFTAGTVVVSNDGSGQVVCTVTGITPGTSSTGYPIGSQDGTECKYLVHYTGTAPAWLAVDVAIDNTGGLFDSGGADGLQLYLKSGSTTFVNSDTTTTDLTGRTFYANDAGTQTDVPATGVSNLLVSATPVSSSTAYEFDLNWFLPTQTTTASGSMTVTLTFHAVQSANNALNTDCSAVAGRQCPAGNGFVWS